MIRAGGLQRAVDKLEHRVDVTVCFSQGPSREAEPVQDMCTERLVTRNWLLGLSGWLRKSATHRQGVRKTRSRAGRSCMAQTHHASLLSGESLPLCQAK